MCRRAPLNRFRALWRDTLHVRLSGSAVIREQMGDMT